MFFTKQNGLIVATQVAISQEIYLQIAKGMEKSYKELQAEYNFPEQHLNLARWWRELIELENLSDFQVNEFLQAVMFAEQAQEIIKNSSAWGEFRSWMNRWVEERGTSQEEWILLMDDKSNT